jgi:hypothetical protein
MAKIVGSPFPGVMCFPDVQIEASAIPEHASKRKKRQRRVPIINITGPSDTGLPTKTSRSRKMKSSSAEPVPDMEASESLGSELKTLQPPAKTPPKKREPKKRYSKVGVVLPVPSPTKPLVLTPLLMDDPQIALDVSASVC